MSNVGKIKFLQKYHSFYWVNLLQLGCTQGACISFGCCVSYISFPVNVPLCKLFVEKPGSMEFLVLHSAGWRGWFDTTLSERKPTSWAAAFFPLLPPVAQNRTLARVTGTVFLFQLNNDSMLPKLSLQGDYIFSKYLYKCQPRLIHFSAKTTSHFPNSHLHLLQSVLGSLPLLVNLMNLMHDSSFFTCQSMLSFLLNSTFLFICWP